MRMEMQEFQELVWEQYRQHGRDLPWRRSEPDGTFDVYKILVSEIMLQQTQVQRVIPKYQTFLERFPDLKALADAPLSAVLAEWSGLGYNRRAKYLHEAAKQLLVKPEPWQMQDLTACRGIGVNTAAATVVYAYNQPLVFVETNIRTVFIHHFFHDTSDVSDKELAPFIERAMDRENPREFFWGLMDWGVYLKATVGNITRLSKHYTRQSAFAGSRRQVRGKVLLLLKDRSLARVEVAELVPDQRLDDILTGLEQEGLITERTGTLHLG